MLILSILVFISFLILSIYSRNENVEKTWCRSILLMPIYKSSSCLHNKIQRFKLLIKKKEKYTKGVEKQKTYQLLKQLYPGVDITRHHSKYRIEKISLFLLVILFSNMLVFLTEMNRNTDSLLVNQRYLMRSSVGNGIKNILMNASISDNHSEEFQVAVGEQRLSKEDAKILLQGITNKLETLILGENISLDEVRKPLSLITKMDDSSVKIEWEVSDYSLLALDGQLGNRVPDNKGELVKLTARISYFDDVQETQVFIRRFPPLLTKKEKLHNEIVDKLLKEDLKSVTNRYFELPDKIGNLQIRWEEPKNEYSKMIILLMMATIFMVSVGKEKDLEKSLYKKKEELAKDYPELINKLVLYMGAGMTSRGAFLKIADDYRTAKRKKGKERYAYEEIVYICNKMSSGSSEKEAYECLGKRCNLPSYKKLITLLTQNLQKGSSALLKSLREESEKAMEERKTQAKRKGEKAETQLLVPMMMMLGIVMILIMFPAYMSFSIG